MSVDNITLDLNHLSFDTTPDLLSNKNNPLLTTSSNYRNNNSSTPSITVTQEKRTLRSKARNRQCVPSDDEEDDDDDELESSDEEDNVLDRPRGKSNPITATTTVKAKHRQPLPSDDEEDDEEEDDDDDSDVEQHQQPSPMYRRLSGIGSTSNLHQERAPTPQVQYQQNAEMAKRHSDGGGNSGNQYYYNNNEYEYNRHSSDDQPIQQPQFHFQEGTQLHHLQQMQQHHQTQIAQFQHQQQHSSFLRPQQQQQQRVSMSGMDLLKQLEQEKAEAKRQKPNFNSSKVRIDKGLLANVPEPGSHNISFQHMAMQQQQQQQQFYHHHHHHHNNGHHHSSKPRHQRSASSLDKQQRQQYQQQAQPPQQPQYGYYPAHAVATAPVGYMYPQQQVYPYLNAGNGNGLMGSPSLNGSSQSLVMMDNHPPSRPGSALSNSSRRRSQD